MKAGVPLLVFPTAVLAALGSAVKHPDLCGPDSNCEIVNINGNQAYRFKENMGPDSEDYISRFGNDTEQRLTARSEDIFTSVIMGKTDMAWGCEGINVPVIEDILLALHELCLDGPTNGLGACDEGSQHKMDISLVEGTPAQLGPGELTLRAEGTYPTWSKHAFINGLRAIPPAGAVHHEDVDYVFLGGFPANPTYGVCSMRRFPNWIQIAKNQGNSLVGYMEFFASADIKSDTETCELVNKVLGAIGGAVSGVLGGFFGIVEATCG